MTAVNQITFSAPSRKIDEGSILVVVARFRDRETAADVTPTNVHYRLDDGEEGEITDWTSVAPGTTATITLSATQNEIRNFTRTLEAKFLSVAADYGLSTEYRDTFRYEVRNQEYVS